MLQISGRPLSGSKADGVLFVNRDTETNAVSKALKLGFSLLLLGDPKSGRTSFLHHLERNLGDRSSVFVDLQRYESQFDSVLAIRAALGDDVRNQPRYERVFEKQLTDFVGLRRIEDEPIIHESDVAEMASASIEQRVILLDNADPDFTHLVFGRFRDVLWQYPHQWIVAADLGQRMQHLRPPADAFFDSVVELEELTRHEASELLRKRVDTAKGTKEAASLRRVIPAIVDSVPQRTPGQLLAAARVALLSEEPEESFREIAWLQQRAAALGRNAAMLFSEIEALGPVHAGDERLLRRLGYTRPRVVQLLKELEEAGLVIARSEGKRRLYEITKPSSVAG